MKQGRWQEFLVEFNFQFEHKVGYTNQVVDALSCNAKLANLRMLVAISKSFVATFVRKHIKENLDQDLVA